MVPKSILDAAKAFLCWDVFTDLSVQLVAMQPAAAFYYPPGNDLQSIVIFYDPQLPDFAEPLFLLFHEAGHALQRQHMAKKDRAGLFARFMSLPAGARKAAFECAAWRLGGELFQRFIASRGLSAGLFQKYTGYGRRCAESYGERGREG